MTRIAARNAIYLRYVDPRAGGVTVLINLFQYINVFLEIN